MSLQSLKDQIQCNPQLSGLGIAITELGLFGIGATFPYLCMIQLRELDPVSFYWCCFTVLTGIWEASFVINYKLVGDQGHYLLVSNTRVWASKYKPIYLLPWKLAILFYGEYAAYADREYMSIRDKWARLIESSHAFFCATFSLLTLILYSLEEDERAEICWSIAMGTQLMNSVLYMGQYFIQTQDMSSPNHNSDEFPCGRGLCKRPFMYVNAAWSLMPVYAIIRLLC
jgi:hypothetical protein